MNTKIIYDYWQQQIQKVNIKISESSPITILQKIKDKNNNLFSYQPCEDKVLCYPHYLQYIQNTDQTNYIKTIDITIEDIQSLINKAKRQLNDVFIVSLSDFSVVQKQKVQENDNNIVLSFSFGIFGNN